MITCNDRQFEVYLPNEELQQCVSALAKRISQDYQGRQPLLCPVLTGSYIFAADLTRYLDFDAEISFVRYTSYQGTHSTGVVKTELPFPSKCTGRDVIIIEDIVDTGNAMDFMLKEIAKLNPKSVAICTMFFKPESFRHDFKIDYIGKSIPNDFILGYGLDYDGMGRFYPDLYKLAEK